MSMLTSAGYCCGGLVTQVASSSGSCLIGCHPSDANPMPSMQSTHQVGRAAGQALALCSAVLCVKGRHMSYPPSHLRRSRTGTDVAYSFLPPVLRTSPCLLALSTLQPEHLTTSARPPVALTIQVPRYPLAQVPLQASSEQPRAPNTEELPQSFIICLSHRSLHTIPTHSIIHLPPPPSSLSFPPFHILLPFITIYQLSTHYSFQLFPLISSSSTTNSCPS